MRLTALGLGLLTSAIACSSASRSGTTPDINAEGGGNATDEAGTGDGGATLGDGGGGILGDGALGDPGPFDSAGGGGGGHVVILLPDGWNRVALNGGSRVNVDERLDSLSPGKDGFVSLTFDGTALALQTTRFGCSQGDCLGLSSGDLSTASIVSGITASGRPAAGPHGNVLVYPATGGPHESDLYAITRTASGWSSPVLLTAASTAAFHHDPVVAPDGSRVAFDCGTSQYQNPGTGICEASIDGTSFRVTMTPQSGPGGSSDNELHHPAYAPDGSLVFEADWNNNETIWRLSPGGGPPVKVSPDDVSDDNSPCVLPDGKIASLWLGRPGNAGNGHELKVMNADGSGAVMLVTDIDAIDVGLSCGD